MATIYVDSAAAGANNGTSWTDAYTSITSTTGAAIKDVILVASTHTETLAANLTFTNADQQSTIHIVSASTATSAYASGAQITMGTYSINGSLSFHGVNFISNSSMRFNRGASVKYQMLHHSCSFDHSGTNGTNVFEVNGLQCFYHLFDSCSWTQSGSANWTGIRGITGGRIVVRNCTFASDFSQSLVNALGFDGIYEFKNCDLSNVTNLVVDNATHGNGQAVFVTIDSCNLNASAAYGDAWFATQADTLRITNCDSGTITAPAVDLVERTPFGTIKSTLAKYRTGGADDGEQANAYSWEMATNANAEETYSALESPPIVRWVGTGSQTVTVYVASGATLNDDDFWVEVSSPGEGGSPTARGTFNSTRMTVLGTPAALTTDSGSTWNGTGVGTKQKIDVSINPTVAGPVTVRCYLAKPSTTVYVDPRLGVA